MNKLIAFANVVVLVAAALMLKSCVVGMIPLDVFLQNSANQPVKVKLHYHNNSADSAKMYRNYFEGMRYAPTLLKPGRKIRDKLSAKLPVHVTDTTVSFTMPPHSTALMYFDRHPQLPAEMKLYLQRADSSVQVLNKWDFLQAAQRKNTIKGRGYSLWYSIQ